MKTNLRVKDITESYHEHPAQYTGLSFGPSKRKKCQKKPVNHFNYKNIKKMTFMSFEYKTYSAKPQFFFIQK